MNKILITAFDPFGTHKFLTLPVGGRNESRKALRKLQQKIPTERAVFLELEVSQNGVDCLNEAIRIYKPKGIFSMGEHAAILSLIIEPYANDVPRTSLPLYSRNKKVMSPAALALGAGLDCSGIGAYYCNNVYLDSLTWTEENDGHSVFLHLPVLRSSEKNYQEIEKILLKFIAHVDGH